MVETLMVEILTEYLIENEINNITPSKKQEELILEYKKKYPSMNFVCAFHQDEEEVILIDKNKKRYILR